MHVHWWEQDGARLWEGQGHNHKNSAFLDAFDFPYLCNSNFSKSHLVIYSPVFDQEATVILFPELHLFQSTGLTSELASKPSGHASQWAMHGSAENYSTLDLLLWLVLWALEEGRLSLPLSSMLITCVTLHKWIHVQK